MFSILDMMKNVAADIFTYQFVQNLFYAQRFTPSLITNLFSAFAFSHLTIKFSDDASNYIIRKYNVSQIIEKIKDVSLTTLFLYLTIQNEDYDMSVSTVAILTGCYLFSKQLQL